MKAISFLGTTAYSPTTYVRRAGEREVACTTPYFAEALVRFFPDLEEVCVLVTPTVAEHQNLADLRQRLGQRLHPVTIPEGHSEAELWEIFDALIGVVEARDRVIFDITNSYRSLPFLTFLAATYLRTAREVDVEAVLYGAFLARDEETNRTPVFDLTPFVSLLDWLTATDQFLFTGDGRYLAHLLTEEGKVRRSNDLKAAGRQLRELSLAMMLCRPLEVMERAGDLDVALERAAGDLAQWARPFSLLAGRIQREYAARALPNPTEEAHVAESLRQQLALVKWYLDNNQIIPAMTLAREWLITAIGWKLGYGFALKLNVRESNRDDDSGVARGLNGLLLVGRVSDGETFTPDDLNYEGQAMWAWPELELLRKLWGNLRGVRNGLDHAGMKHGPMKAAKLARKARQDVWPRLRELAERWDLLPTP
jgi:hypothetical protein